MKLHILSDLHLGVAGFTAPPTDADLIVLAGDIARPARALAWARQLPRPALYVAGNHEFYAGSLDQTPAEIRRLCAGTAVQLLDCDVTVRDGVRFLGATLWSDFASYDAQPQPGPAARAAVGFSHDFSRIRLRDDAAELFSPAESARQFERQAAWLQDRLAEAFDGPTVVITHHAPSRRSIHPRFAGSLLNACFVSDLERLMDGTRVALWIHGHLHDSFDYGVNGTRVVCNPRGYVRDGVTENVAFDPGLVVQV